MVDLLVRRVMPFAFRIVKFDFTSPQSTRPVREIEGLTKIVEIQLLQVLILFFNQGQRHFR